MIPKRIIKNNKVYEFKKQYPNYYLYENAETGFRECFQEWDLVKHKNERLTKLPKWESEAANYEM